MKSYQFFVGEYHIEKTLARSQYSLLFLGKKVATGQQVLLKLWLTARADSAEAQEHVCEEVATLQEIKHPHLLPILEVRVDERRVCLVSEYAQGGSLNERLRQKGEEAFALDQALLIIEQTGQALQELHAHNIIHGNLTPQAIFFDEAGQVKLGEFLVQSVRACIQDYQPALEENVPRSLYMAPEQFHGRLDAKTDQYALGCLAYLLLTGRVPFTGSARATLLQKHERDEPPALTITNPAIPAHIEAAVLKSLAKRPEERYSSIEAFLEALDVSGKKALADQSTVKQAVPGLSPEASAASDGAQERKKAVSSGNTGWIRKAGGGVLRPLLAPSLASQLRPGWLAQPAQRRGLYVAVPALLLVLALFFITGRWLFLFGGSPLPKKNATGMTPTSALLAPATPANGQTTATVIAIQLSTPTPAPEPPRPSLKPSPTAPATSTPVTPAPVQVSLTSFFNNKGIGSFPGQANFDGSGYSYPANELPSGGLITVQGVVYLFPNNAPRTNDNVIASGQTIPLTPGNYRQAFLLVASSWGSVSSSITVRYTDGSTTVSDVTVPDWYDGPLNGLSASYRYSSYGIDRHAVYIYVLSITLDSARTASALILPALPYGPYYMSRIHLFSLTLLH
jgi:serine/threonine protein kinase